MKYLDSYNIVLLRNHLPEVIQKLNILFKLLGFKFFVYNHSKHPHVLGVRFEPDLSGENILGYLFGTKNVNTYYSYPKINDLTKYNFEVLFNGDIVEYKNNTTDSWSVYEIHPKHKSDILIQSLQKILEFFKSIDTTFKTNQGDFNMPFIKELIVYYIEQLVEAKGIVNETDLIKFLHNSVANNSNSFQILKSIKDIPRNDCDTDKRYMYLKKLFKKFYNKELGEQMGELGF